VDRRYARAIADRPKQPTNAKRISELRTEVENLTDAIARGALRTSKALAARLVAAEDEIERLSDEDAARPKLVKLPTPLGERYRRMVVTLEAELSRDVHKARTALRQIVGDDIPVIPHESGKHLVARIGLDTQALVAGGGSEIFVVAGARYN
jgi:hypothetical protein